MPTRIVELMIIVLQATANMFIYLVFFVFWPEFYAAREGKPFSSKTIEMKMPAFHLHCRYVRIFVVD